MYPTRSAVICNTDGKENTKDVDVKVTFIWLSCTLAVVTSDVNGIIRSPAIVVDVICIYIQKSILWYDSIPHRASVSIPERGTTPLSFIDDVCHTLPFAFKRVLSIAVIERSTMPSKTNRYPIVDILSLISVEMVFNLLPNVRLDGMDTRPQAIASLRL